MNRPCNPFNTMKTYEKQLPKFRENKVNDSQVIPSDVISANVPFNLVMFGLFNNDLDRLLRLFKSIFIAFTIDMNRITVLIAMMSNDGPATAQTRFGLNGVVIQQL